MRKKRVGLKNRIRMALVRQKRGDVRFIEQHRAFVGIFEARYDAQQRRLEGIDVVLQGRPGRTRSAGWQRSGTRPRRPWSGRGTTGSRRSGPWPPSRPPSSVPNGRARRPRARRPPWRSAWARPGGGSRSKKNGDVLDTKILLLILLNLCNDTWFFSSLDCQIGRAHV